MSFLISPKTPGARPVRLSSARLIYIGRLNLHAQDIDGMLQVN